jgi:hypothetical protein
MKITDSLLPEFDQEMANTRKTLERVPDDKLAWKPHPKSFDMGSLATHIVNMLGWTVDTIQKDSFDVAPPGAPPYKEEPVASNEELLDKFDKNLVLAREAIAGSSDEHLLKPWSLLASGKALLIMPRIACAWFRHEPHYPPSRPTRSVSASEQYRGTGDLRPVGL